MKGGARLFRISSQPPPNSSPPSSSHSLASAAAIALRQLRPLLRKAMRTSSRMMTPIPMRIQVKTLPVLT